MKHLYYCLILFSWSLTALAQTEPSDSAVDAELNITKKRPYFKLEYGYGALCNSISTSELIKFTSNDFLQDEDKDELLNSINGSLRFGFARQISLSYQQPGYQILDIHKKGHGFAIRNNFYTSGNLSNDLLKLALYGNKPYEEQTLDLAGTKFETWYYTTLDYNFDVLLDSLLPIHLSVGINVGHDYNFYQVKKGSLYTGANGEFLDLDLDYRLRDRVLDTEPMAGLGISVGANTVLKINEKASLELAIQDFGFIYWNNGRMVDADSTFRFQGFEFSNVLDLSDSLTNSAVDEYEESFYYNEDGGYMRLTPFRLSATYLLKVKKGRLKAISATADYRYLAGYYPRLALGAHITTGRKQQLLAQLTTGGYTLASLDLAYELTIARYWKLNLAITNFSGLVVPTISGGAFGVIGLSWEY